MSTPYRISFDNVEWVEVTPEKFREMVADRSVNCLVERDWGNGRCYITLDDIRNARPRPGPALDNKGNPVTLFGRPVIYTDDEDD